MGDRIFDRVAGLIMRPIATLGIGSLVLLAAWRWLGWWILAVLLIGAVADMLRWPLWRPW